jgi:hypothetical protein
MPARPDQAEPVRPVAAVRGMAVMLGGSLALAAASLASFAASARALRERRLPGRAAGGGVIATAIYAVKVRPWMLRWGATRAESEGELPTRAVDIDAPADTPCRPRAAANSPLVALYGLLLELPHFVMERKMLLGIKERAERTGTRSGRAVSLRRRTPSPARS